MPERCGAAAIIVHSAAIMFTIGTDLVISGTAHCVWRLCRGWDYTLFKVSHCYLLFTCLNFV